MAVALLRVGGGAARRRRVVLAVVMVVGAGFLVVGALAQFPVTVADTATLWIFGGRGGDGQAQVPAICATPPPFPSPPPAASGDATTDQAAAVAAPPPGLDADGRPTPQAVAVIERIPAGVDVSVAQGWIMFGLAHPDTGLDFAAFADRYDQTAATLSAQASALDVVATMDPAADYSPYLLLSQAGAYQMVRQGSISATDDQRDALIEAVGITCKGPASGG